MPNHVHLVVVPEKKDSLSNGLSVIHRHYARRIHLRREWKGFLWQGRFYSCVLDEYHLYAALRYVELNPVRAGLARHPADYPWSSARAHLLGENDPLLSSHEAFTGIADWSKFLGECLGDKDINALRTSSHTVRPLGDERFIRRLESLTGRRLTRAKPGPKPKTTKLSKELKKAGSLFGPDELR